MPEWEENVQNLPPGISVANADAGNVGINVASDITGKSSEQLIRQASEKELPKAREAAEAARTASVEAADAAKTGAAKGASGDAQGKGAATPAEKAEKAKKAAIWWAARAIVYAKAAKAKAES